MGIIKITIFQKNLNEGINLSTIKKLSSLKSDFLLLPEYFYSDNNSTSFNNLKDKYLFTTDWLCKLDETYKGVVIGGSMIREINGHAMISAPVLSEGQIVDWYNKQTLSKKESSHAKKGTELSSFILGGQRFAIVLGEEIYNKTILNQINEDGIKLVFSLSMIPDPKGDFNLDEDEEKISNIAKENNLHILRSCPVGEFMGSPLCGRSIAVNPTGVSWRISKEEVHSELLKTVMINVNTL